MLSEIEWHQAASKANSIAFRIELIEEIKINSLLSPSNTQVINGPV